MKESVSSAANRQFALSGPAGFIDRRVVPLRGDLACITLAGHVFAPHYAESMTYHCTAPYAAIYSDSKEGAPAIGELLSGEPFCLLDRIGDWAWGQASDETCGFVRADMLAEGEGKLVEADSSDAAALAEAAVGQPFAEGGQGGAGYCAAGLVRRAALAQGTELPAFADLQQASDALDPADGPARGHLLFSGDIAAICVSESEAVTAQSDKGVVKLAIAELLAGDGVDPEYRKIAP